jgi:hypothetical protein
LSVLRLTDSDSPLVSFGHCFVCPSINGFWFVLWHLHTFGHCFVCPSINGFSFPRWCPLAITLSVLRRILFRLWFFLAITLSVLRLTDSDSPFGIFWPLLCLSCD